MQQIYQGIKFDSDQEVMYYRYLKENKIKFIYQNEYYNRPLTINVGRRKTYKPDFVLLEENHITIIELKGWSKWTGNEDDNIMDFMKNKVKYDVKFLEDWLTSIGVDAKGKEIGYQRIKYLKTYGFVDYGWKNPNTISNKRKAKINEQQDEIKSLKEENKLLKRYYQLSKKSKLTKAEINRLAEIEERLGNLWSTNN